ncbi:choice-of-anchor Q domain-containing protein [Nostoc sp. UHCC 0302]|uniref:choice-of-anchor Q domain-containing protein n=1 Tax=Nostoc sp. UHCC 0302 TaxID=3134896 RepID=UPI00311C9EDA
MTTFTVTNTNDSGSGSLRQAILDANALTGKDIINFDGIFADNIADTIALTSSSLLITDNLNIQGTNTNLPTVSNATNRVFNIESGVTAEISFLSITKGNSEEQFSLGGGIQNLGTLILSDSIISGSTAWEKGSGIYNSGTLIVNNSTISNNTAGFFDYENSDIKNGYGGGIYNTGSVTLSYSTISGNVAGLETGGGGGIYNDGTLTVFYSTITNNIGFYEAGGISNNGTVTVLHSNITNNSALFATGGIDNNLDSSILVIDDSLISGNTGGTGILIGGGIENSGTLIVNNSTISNNLLDARSRFATGSGGISNVSGGRAIVNNSTIGSNEGITGGGIFNDGILTVNNSTFSSNRAYAGGGIFNDGRATINNSTFSNNYASAYGGGISNGSAYPEVLSEGEIPEFYGSTLTVNNSTIINNSTSFAQGSGGIFNIDQLFNSSITGDGSATVKNSIIAGNFFINADDPTKNTNLDVGGIFISNGHNLIGNLSGSTGFNADEELTVPLTDVLDTTLRDNGGLVQTHALVIGSPAINAGENADIPADTQDQDRDSNTSEPIPFDQRGSGYLRISGGRVDIGAYEAVVNVINGTSAPDTINGTVGNDIITGLQGRDILSGGLGADTFVYTNIRELADTITDFAVGTDKIVLQGLFQRLNLSNLNFASAVAGGYLQFDSQGSNTVVLIDPDGTAGKSRAITFLTLQNIAASSLNNSVNFVI